MEGDTNENSTGKYNDYGQLTPHQKYTDAYVGILNAYQKQYENSATAKNVLKKGFFKVIKILMYCMIGVFVVAIVGSFIIIGSMIKNKYSSIEILAGTIVPIVSSFATMTISILKLPKIIARYLFNKEEDVLMKDIIQNIQTYEIGASKYERVQEKLDVETAENRLEQGDSDVEFEEAPSLQNGFPESNVLVQGDNTQCSNNS